MISGYVTYDRACQDCAIPLAIPRPASTRYCSQCSSERTRQSQAHGRTRRPPRAAKVSLPVVQPQSRTRGDCIDGPRPCPEVRCRHHLGNGDAETCSLDVADRGEHTLDEVGELMGISYERVRQIEEIALRKARKNTRRLDV
jgi:hypothetical protein